MAMPPVAAPPIVLAPLLVLVPPVVAGLPPLPAVAVEPEPPLVVGFDVAGSPLLPQAASWNDKPRMAATVEVLESLSMAVPVVRAFGHFVLKIGSFGAAGRLWQR
jgi:hypothetical protein